jgi:chromosome segregation ATPase
VTPTPRTDAAIAASDGQWSFTLRDLAQELERELAVWKHEAKRLEAELETFDEQAIIWWCEYQDLKVKARELQETRSDLEFRRGLYKLQADRVERLERELAESTESLDFQTQLNREVIELEKKTLGERNDARKELEQIKAILADPVAVHLNMMRGTIAWTPANLRHLLGDTGDARAELASLKATIADPDEVELAMIRGEIAIPNRVGFDYIIGNT